MKGAPSATLPTPPTIRAQPQPSSLGIPRSRREPRGAVRGSRRGSLAPGLQMEGGGGVSGTRGWIRRRYILIMRGGGIEETAAVRAGAPPRRYHKTKISFGDGAVTSPCTYCKGTVALVKMPPPLNMALTFAASPEVNVRLPREGRVTWAGRVTWGLMMSAIGSGWGGLLERHLV